MKFVMAHNNINVRNLEKSLRFYEEAVGLKEARRIEAEDGSYIIAYLASEETPHLLELTWLRDWDRPYNLGDNEFHFALRTDDFERSLQKHKDMDCVVFENEEMGIYFIADPDGYWVEILPPHM